MEATMLPTRCQTSSALASRPTRGNSAKLWTPASATTRNVSTGAVAWRTKSLNAPASRAMEEIAAKPSLISVLSIRDSVLTEAPASTSTMVCPIASVHKAGVGQLARLNRTKSDRWK